MPMSSVPKTPKSALKVLRNRTNAPLPRAVQSPKSYLTQEIIAHRIEVPIKLINDFAKVDRRLILVILGYRKLATLS